MSTSSRRPTAIVVEDNQSIRTLIQRSLEKLDFNVICAYDGQDALRAATEHHGEIDVAVIDLRLPHLSGETVAEALYQRYPDLKVIFTSGHPVEELSQRHEAFLPKPFLPDALATLVVSLVGSAERK